MSTLSVPLTPSLEIFVEQMVQQGVGSNKADVARRALERYREDQLIEAILQAQRDRKDGKEVRGNLRDILSTLS